jgi:hypothetical protein
MLTLSRESITYMPRASCYSDQERLVAVRVGVPARRRKTPLRPTSFACTRPLPASRSQIPATTELQTVGCSSMGWRRSCDTSRAASTGLWSRYEPLYTMRH